MVCVDDVVVLLVSHVLGPSYVCVTCNMQNRRIRSLSLRFVRLLSP